MTVSQESPLRAVLWPRSVAVIGASRRPGSIGGEVFKNLVATGFCGPVYPVNPGADFVHSVTCYPSILDVPGPVDLAVIVIPAEKVTKAARQCAEKGVRALVVISAGFGEIGGAGARRQQELVAICRESGMRLVGPNCMGVLNTSPDVRLNATFAPCWPPRGRVAFLSQSGALGLAVIDHARALGLGLSSFVSVGNKADISGNDLLEYWAEDSHTDAVLLYLESFGNPRKFARLARKLARIKPIVAVKSGRTVAGVRATESHTGALLAASDATVDALFEQAGVIRTDTLQEMFDVATLVANQPAPRGRRVAILTNAGGPGILCADVCEANGLSVLPLPEGVRRGLARLLPPEASTRNPVDMTAAAAPEAFRSAMEVLGSCDIDALVVIYIPPLAVGTQEVARAIREGAERLPGHVTLLSVFMSARGIPEELRGAKVRIPSYTFPEEAALALARVARYGVWRAQSEDPPVELSGLRSDEAAALILSALPTGPRWLGPEEVTRLLGCYGLPLAVGRLAGSPEEAGAVAEALESPVALKAIVPGLVHKTDVGGVRLSLRGAAEVMAAARAMVADLGAAGHTVQGFVVQRMVSAGVEMLVGVVHDPAFGPVVAVGAGGAAVELLQDVRVSITPIGARQAGAMIRGLKTFPLLSGYRGAPAADVAALQDVLLRASILAERHPEVVEMDLNPVIVLPSGAVIVDARVRIGDAARDSGAANPS